MVLVCAHGLVKVAVAAALALFPVLFHGQVVRAEDHILRRNRYGFPVHGFEQVVGRKHQESCLCLRLCGKRNVHRHLVAVEVRIERGANQRVQFDCAALYQHRLERLNGKAVQRWRAVEKHGMLFDYVFKRVPNAFVRRIIGAVDLLLRVLDVGGLVHFHQPLDYERLEQLDGHFLRQAALVNFKARADDDYRTPRIVHALAEQVLAETPLLAAKHFGKRFERAVGSARNRLAALAVVDQRVHGFLQHSLFVADHDFGRSDFHQLLQAVVARDHAAIKLVQVRGRETSAVELGHGANIRRGHGNHVEDHPIEVVSRAAERLHNFQPFDNARFLLSGCVFEFLAQIRAGLLNVDPLQQLFNGLGSHADAEIVFIEIAVFLILLFGKHRAAFERRGSRVKNHVLGKIEHLFEGFGRHIQHQRHARRHGLEIPDMRNGRRKLDMPHALAAHLFGGNVHAAFFAFMNFLAMGVLVLSAGACAVLGRPENPLAEQTADFRFQRSVIDGLGLCYLAVGPLADHLRRRQSDLN